MSTFSAPSKPDAFQPIKLESVERLCIRNDAVPLKKKSYYGSGNPKETIGYYIKFGTAIVRVRVQD